MSKIHAGHKYTVNCTEVCKECDGTGWVERSRDDDKGLEEVPCRYCTDGIIESYVPLAVAMEELLLSGTPEDAEILMSVRARRAVRIFMNQRGDMPARVVKLRAVAEAADVVMHHFADSHWNERDFTKMLAAMEPLRLALLAAGYGLPESEIPS